MNKEPFRPQPAVNSSVLIVVALLFGFTPLVAAALLAARGITGSWQSTFAPLTAALVVVLWVAGLRLLERKLAGDAAGWPPVLFGIPVGGAVAGLAAAAVDPVHHWLGNAITGAVWGALIAVWGWWRFRSRNRPIQGINS